MMDWIEELHAREKANLWAGFTAASPDDLLEIEHLIRRTLPEDFREFYRRVGYGQWPRAYGGGIWPPKDIIAMVGAPIYFVAGSLTQGEEWATEVEHRELWLTHGESNPDPRRFTESALHFHGMSLLDLLEIGSDGCAGYQMLNLSNSSEIRYLVVYESTGIDFPSGSFREGILAITDWLVRSRD
jgi:hypothetical protein